MARTYDRSLKSARVGIGNQPPTYPSVLCVISKSPNSELDSRFALPRRLGRVKVWRLRNEEGLVYTFRSILTWMFQSRGNKIRDGSIQSSLEQVEAAAVLPC